MQAPPPPTMSPMMNRNRMMGMVIYLVIGLGLLLLAIGAIVTLLGNQSLTAPTIDQQNALANYKAVWGPAIWNFGMFLFLGGLIGWIMFSESVDPFIRLFAMVTVFIAHLLILVQSLFFFGA